MVDPISPPLSIVVTWLYDDVTKSNWIPLALGLGLGYYWLGGLPNQGQDMMQIAQAYLLGGVGNYAYAYFDGPFKRTRPPQ